MDLFTGLAIYVLFWWIALFIALPFGARSQADEGLHIPGTERGAPVKSPMIAKFRVATIMSAIAFALFLAGFHLGWFDILQSPFFAQPGRPEQAPL